MMVIQVTPESLLHSSISQLLNSSTRNGSTLSQMYSRLPSS